MAGWLRTSPSLWLDILDILGLGCVLSLVLQHVDADILAGNTRLELLDILGFSLILQYVDVLVPAGKSRSYSLARLWLLLHYILAGNYYWKICVWTFLRLLGPQGFQVSTSSREAPILEAIPDTLSPESTWPGTNFSTI